MMVAAADADNHDHQQQQAKEEEEANCKEAKEEELVLATDLVVMALGAEPSGMDLAERSGLPVDAVGEAPHLKLLILTYFYL